MQAPAWQTEPAGQALPHAPQFCVSVCVSTHTPPHAVRPAPQPRRPQRPNAQLSPAGQALPQAPQFWLSLRSEQRSPQRVSPSAHDDAQAPREHTRPAGQALPQAPQ